MTNKNNKLPNLFDLSFMELVDFVQACGEKKFRAAQVWQWLWEKRATGFEQMTNLSKSLRELLAEKAVLERPSVHTVAESKDGTVKFLLEFTDGALVETVLIPEEKHYTQCLSTQVGCAMGCSFCSTGQLGITRNMTQSEILGQILAAQDYLQETNCTKPLKNLVFMGMGEPLNNLHTLLKSLESLQSEKGLYFPSRKITVSTVGIPGDKIARFGAAERGKLAVSLHAPTQELREKIMPIAARAMPMDKLIAELKAYPLKPRDRITIEYILLGGINDTPEHARQLVRTLSHVKCKVNLIVYNKAKGMPYEEPTREQAEQFAEILQEKGLTAIIRKSKGRDIKAACGQLAADSK